MSDITKKCEYMYEQKKKLIEAVLSMGIALPKNATWRQIRNAIIFYYTTIRTDPFYFQNNYPPIDGLEISEKECMKILEDRIKEANSGS